MTNTPTPDITGDLKAQGKRSAFDRLRNALDVPDEHYNRATRQFIAIFELEALISEHAALLAERDALKDAAEEYVFAIDNASLPEDEQEYGEPFAMLRLAEARDNLNVLLALTSPERTEG